ncbi:hypothetical protein [uncultured Nocardioides sp.]|uniref:hypothetical protein n=1 Tax=uncultured Nocardioides sp. TaxID=198441 RepID=UPI00261F7AF3|nr:hypothetical protein [uncultured Nocardioides sp.]
MISTSSRRLARQADDAASAAVRGATSIHDTVLQSVAFDAAIHADDAAVLALAAVDGTEQDALELHVRAALAHADAVLRLTSRAAS